MRPTAFVLMLVALSSIGAGAGAQARPGVPRFDRAVPLDAAPDTSADASLGDVDGDGHLDVVLSKGRHWPAVDQVLLGDDGAVPYALTVADLDLDGRPDVVVGFVRAPSVAFLNRGGGRFERVGFGDVSGAVYGFAVGDLDEDGRPDIVAARSGAPSVLYLASP